MTSPHLHVDAPPGRAKAIVLVLHGGREASLDPVRPGQLAVLRMRPFASSLRRAGPARGLAVARLRYAVRGWNGESRSPVGDADWALDELTHRFPGRPIALVGHSMGGRTALYVAGHDGVAAVVALAPWVVAADPVRQLAGRRLLIAHGTRDRLTNPRASAAYAERAAATAEAVSYVEITGEGHAMRRRPGVWHDLATGFVLGVLCADGAGAIRDTTTVLSRALAGVPSLVV